MKKQLLLLLSVFWVMQVIQWTGPGVNGQVTPTVMTSNPGTYQAQVVANPGAVLGDSSQFAPLFCGEFLNGFQSSNLGASPVAPGDFQQAFGCQIENNQFLRFIPCEAEVEMTITLSNCPNGVGLEAGVFSTTDCQNFTSLQNSVTLNSGSTDVLHFTRCRQWSRGYN